MLPFGYQASLSYLLFLLKLIYFHIIWVRFHSCFILPRLTMADNGPGRSKEAGTQRRPPGGRGCSRNSSTWPIISCLPRCTLVGEPAVKEPGLGVCVTLLQALWYRMWVPQEAWKPRSRPKFCQNVPAHKNSSQKYALVSIWRKK